jgi:hypothetical protein
MKGTSAIGFARKWRALASGFLGVLLLVAVMPVVGAPATTVDEVVVRFRDGAVSPDLAALPADREIAFGQALGFRFVVVGRKHGGAFRLQLTPPHRGFLLGPIHTARQHIGFLVSSQQLHLHR